MVLIIFFVFAIVPNSYAQSDVGKGSVTSENSVSHNIYFSLADEHGAPKAEQMSSFDCSDKIYTVVELSNYPVGEHHVSVRWKDPSDTTQENTQYPFNIVNTETRIWAWLSLTRGTGAGMLQWINPAAGLEGFIGPWLVEVSIDGKKISSKSFEVNC